MEAKKTCASLFLFHAMQPALLLWLAYLVNEPVAATADHQ
jgi:hypothetical protein